MKRLSKNINAAAIFEDTPIFSPIDVVEMLSQIDILKGCRIGFHESMDGLIELIIDDIAYPIN